MNNTTPIKMAHIAPTAIMGTAAEYSDGVYMALQHLCKPGSPYVDGMKRVAEANYVYLDNSAFELGKSCSTEDLIQAGKLINANCLILPDGRQSREEVAEVKQAGFDVMVIPARQSDMGPQTMEALDRGDMGLQFMEALDREDIDFVGLSYTHASAYMGLDVHNVTSRDKFLGRFVNPNVSKKIHLLGATLPEEAILLRKFSEFIYSWDSSMCAWSGVHTQTIDGLDAKFSIPVDFDSELEWTNEASYNVAYMKGLLDVRAVYNG